MRVAGRSAARVAAAASLALGGCVVEQDVTGPPPSYGHQIVSGAGGACLDVQGGGASDGTPLILFHCHGSPNQGWSLSNGQIVGTSGSCVDVQGSAPVDGSPAILVHCNGMPSQRWNLVNGGIVGIGSKCLDTSGQSGSDRTPVILSPCVGAPSQQWAVD